MRKVLLALVAVSALVGASCSGGSSGGGAYGGGGSSSSSAGCTAANATDLTGQTSFTITIKDFAYHPSCFSAKNFSTITIDNQDSVAHTFTVINTSINVKVDGGQSVTQPNANMAPATYQFHCMIHPQITGTIIVTQ